MKKLAGLIFTVALIITCAMVSFAECRWDDMNYGLRAEWDDTDSKVTLQLYKGSSYKVGSKIHVSKGTTSYDFTKLIRETGPGTYKYSLTDGAGRVIESEYYQVGEELAENLKSNTWFFENGGWVLKDYRDMKLTGWQFDSSKWYYLDPKTCYCLMDTITPDGYYVDKTGAWDGKESAYANSLGGR